MFKKILNNKKTCQKLIIFDKDGTLINFIELWKPWMNKSVNNINKLINNDPYSVNNDCSNDFYNILGYDNFNNKLRFNDKSLLAYEDQNIIEHMLSSSFSKKYNIPKHDIKKCMLFDNNDKNFCKPICNLEPILNNFIDNNVKLAICTSDNRLNTINNLKYLGIYDYFDILLCSGDNNFKPKPNPNNINYITSSLDIPLYNTYMVGDTSHDILMANNAGVNGVGVLSGVGDYSSLKYHTDIIINSVEDLPNIIFD